MSDSNPQLDVILADILGTAKYASISPVLVRAVVRRELRAHPRQKEALKEAKSKLHQVAASYIGGDFNRGVALDLLRAVFADHPSDAAMREVCRTIMAMHASTRERLAILERLYATLFAPLPPVTSILDVACGLNPLAYPWMPLAPQARYYAYDAVGDLVSVVAEFLQRSGIPGEAGVCDLLSGVPEVRVDVALALKTLPVLDQVERGAGMRLLRELNARWIVVSFPTRSLGGRGRGMAANYERQFLAAIADEPWTVRSYEFQTELAFVVDKQERR